MAASFNVPAIVYIHTRKKHLPDTLTLAAAQSGVSYLPEKTKL
jgi:hypothetical protein